MVSDGGHSPAARSPARPSRLDANYRRGPARGQMLPGVGLRTQDSLGTHGLLYFAAPRDDRRKQEQRQGFDGFFRSTWQIIRQHQIEYYRNPGHEVRLE